MHWLWVLSLLSVYVLESPPNKMVFGEEYLWGWDPERESVALQEEQDISIPALSDLLLPSLFSVCCLLHCNFLLSCSPCWWRHVWAKDCKIERSFWCHKSVIVMIWNPNPCTSLCLAMVHSRRCPTESESDAVFVTLWFWLTMEDCTSEGIAALRCQWHSLRGVDNIHSAEVEHRRKKCHGHY